MATDLGPTWKISSFGSAASGFYTRFSDLDVTCYQVLPDAERMSAREALVLLRPIIERHGAFQVTEVIASARIPLLKLQYQNKLDVDISFQNAEPLPNTQLLRAYARLSSVIRHLVILIKIWAKAEEVCGAPDGHLSSYTLTLMTIYFLQVDPMVKLPAFPTSDFTGFKNVPAVADVSWHCPLKVEDLICRFFEFYTTAFYWGYEVVSPRLGERLYSNNPAFRELQGKDNESTIHVEDPFLLHRNLSCVLGEVQYAKLCTRFQAAHESIQMGLAPPGFRQALALCHQKAMLRQAQDTAAGIGPPPPPPQMAAQPRMPTQKIKQVGQQKQPQPPPMPKGKSPDERGTEAGKNGNYPNAVGAGYVPPPPREPPPDLMQGTYSGTGFLPAATGRPANGNAGSAIRPPAPPPRPPDTPAPGPSQANKKNLHDMAPPPQQVPMTGLFKNSNQR